MSCLYETCNAMMQRMISSMLRCQDAVASKEEFYEIGGGDNHKKTYTRHLTTVCCTYTNAGWVVETKHEDVFRINHKDGSYRRCLLSHGILINHAVRLGYGTIAVGNDGKFHFDRSAQLRTIVGFHVLEPFFVCLDAIYRQGHHLATNGTERVKVLAEAAKFCRTDRMKGTWVRTQDSPMTLFPFVEGPHWTKRRVTRKVGTFVANA